MSTSATIPCPNCGYDIAIDIFSCRNGTQILCRRCRKLITVHFKDKTPEEVKREIEKGIKDVFNGTSIEVRIG